MNTGNGIIFFAAGGLKVMWAGPEKHIMNFFGLNIRFSILFQRQAVYEHKKQ